MAEKKRDYESSMGSIQELKDTLNTDETDLEKALQSIKAAKNTAGEKVTRCVYKDDDDIELGALTVEKFTEARKDDAVIEGEAFILTVRTKVLVFRDGSGEEDEDEEDVSDDI